MFVLADVLLPMPVMRVARWVDVRLNPVERMAARGVILPPNDAALFFRDLFPNADAAQQAIKRYQAPCSPYEYPYHRGNTEPALREVWYRPEGQRRQNRKAWVAPWRADTLRDDLEDVLGELAHYSKLRASTPQQEVTMPLPTAAAISAMTDEEKIATRMRLRATPPDGTAPLVADGYGELLPSRELFRGAAAPSQIRPMGLRIGRVSLSTVGDPDPPPQASATLFTDYRSALCASLVR